MSVETHEPKGQYDHCGQIHIVRKGDTVLIRSRYTRGALTAIWIALAILIIGAVLLALVSLRLALSTHPPDPNFSWRYALLIVPTALGAIIILLWGLGYFYRKDELIITESACSFRTLIPFRRTQGRTFHRSEMVRLMITHATYLHGLRLELIDGGVLFYSHRDLEVVRGAADFLKPVLNLPVGETEKV